MLVTGRETRLEARWACSTLEQVHRRLGSKTGDWKSKSARAGGNTKEVSCF